MFVMFDHTDLKASVNMFWQVQPDLDDLTVNMEDNEGADGAPPKSLGKLQFSLDYDFQKGEVCNHSAELYLSLNVNFIIVVVLCE